MAGGSPLKAILYAFFANLGIAIAKTVATIFTGSSSMLAEAIHSYADTCNQLLLLLGLHRAKRPPDDEHPLGYGKVSYFWSFIVALLLFSLGGLFSLYEGWHKLAHPEPLKHLWVALGVLGLAIVLEGLSMYGCMREVNARRGDRGLWRWLNESRNSELVVVFGEDLGALVGLMLAFGFLTAAGVTGDARYDALGSMSIGVVLLVISVFVAVRIKALLIGRSADPDLVDAIEEHMAEDPDIQRVFNVITVQMGAQVMLAAKIRLREHLDVHQASEKINRLEARLQRQFPEIEWCFVEPDLED
ncbi:MAG: cation diffusion facilitator family transporter [Gammaproteobacteria bacterium]|nr:cation diffusion facilitator family transporter [Gammaproteobacteria bacterium]NIR61443.1 cation diffusion facilitator family transporter [Gammaproteobacteria bacterium]NIR91279.1 cation diffusion facilitator family transporter [Gammaproteobacteria bacterium]